MFQQQKGWLTLQYENPEIPEGINTSQEHPLKEFILLTGGVLLVITLFITSLGFVTEYATRFIPFQFEVEIAKSFYDGKEEKAITGYLQELANRLSKFQGLPEDMSVTVHYVDSDIVNAFATLGGHIVLFRGLLEKITHENALAMVIAHEIAHIKYRHPIKSLGRGVAVQLVLASVTGFSGGDVAGNVFGTADLLTESTFSREQEQMSDETALRSIEKLYGHVSGADDLFKLFLEEDKNQIIKIPKFLSSHPLTEQRIQDIYAWSAKHNVAFNKATELLPAVYHREVNGR